MAKIYVVFSLYNEVSKGGEDIYNSENITKVFDSEEKAINWIHEEIKHELEDDVGHRYPNSNIIRHIPDVNHFHSWIPIMSWEVNDEDVYICQRYMYEPHDVE
jgi:hypothetical protein